MTKRLDDEPCPRLEALSALTDDALPPLARVSLEAHVAGCSVCAPVLDELRQLRTRFAALPRDAGPEFDVAADVDRRIGALGALPPSQASRRPAARRRPWWQLALLAPGGAASVALGLWLGGVAPLPATIGSSASSAGATTAAQMAAFSTLPPGSLCPAGFACGGAPR